MRRRPSRCLAVAVAAVALAGCSGGTATVDAFRWRAPSHEASTVTLILAIGPSDEVLDGQVVSESATEVVVAATIRRAGGDQDAVAVLHEVQVTLEAPIGDRAVLNRDGSVVPEQPKGTVP